jgi:hypothetical protein
VTRYLQISADICRYLQISADICRYLQISGRYLLEGEEIGPKARRLRVTWLKTIGCSRGGHSCKLSLYSSWLSSIKALKLVNAVAGLEK